MFLNILFVYYLYYILVIIIIELVIIIIELLLFRYSIEHSDILYLNKPYYIVLIYTLVNRDIL